MESRDTETEQARHMSSMYLRVKLVHVLAGIVSVGGVIIIALLNPRVSRERDAALSGALARQGAFFGMAVKPEQFPHLAKAPATEAVIECA